jgi:hypothetical protein
MVSLDNLRKNKNKRLEELQKKAQDTGKEAYGTKDDRFWNLSRDEKTGIGKAIIRFIPSAEAKDSATVFSHSFKNEETGKWMIDTCPTTHYHNEWDKCPVCQLAGQYYEEGTEDSKKLASSVRRKKKYISNIYVVKDPKSPENDGKVFLFQYGQKIHDKIISMAKDEYGDGEIVDVFDLEDGRDFTLRSKKNNGGWIDYDDSSFETSNCFSKFDDDKLNSILQSSHALDEFISEDKIPAYEKLKDRLDKVMGKSKTSDKAKVIEDAVETPKATKQEKVKETKSILESISSSDSDEEIDIDDILANI